MGGNRAGKGEHAKSNNTALIHWGSVLDWDGKALQSAKKLPKHILKTAQFHSAFVFFSLALSASNRNSFDMCKYQEGQKKI